MTDSEMIKQMYEHFLKWNFEFGVIQAQVEMLMKLYYFLMGAVITSAIGSIWSVVLHYQKKERIK